MQLYQLINVLLIMLFINIVESLYEGDPCNHASKDVPGVCKRLDQCPNAIQELKSGIRPQHCGFANLTPIVCCPSEATAITSTVPPTIIATSTNSPIGQLLIGKNRWLGGPCYHASKHVSGVCKRKDQCSNSIQEVKVGMSIRPQLCGFANFTPIVCCPSEATETMNITPTTIISTATKSNISQLPVGEKSRLACESYRNLAYKMVNYSSLGSPNELRENCPWDHRSIGVNFNGGVAEEGEFPHMVLLNYDTTPIKYLCGGSLISEKYVLTAAQCLRSYKNGVPTRVRLGDLDYADPDDDEHVQEIKIKERIAHPLYVLGISYHDIALLELEHPAQLSLYVKPICLYRWDPTGKVHSGMVTGWGQNQLHETNTKLLKGGIQYFTQETCNSIHGASRILPSGVDPETQICFGSKGNNSVDTCSGDGGGPIQIYNKDVYCSYYTFGITSWGSPCGYANMPSGYTKLYKYIEWIESIVWP